MVATTPVSKRVLIGGLSYAVRFPFRPHTPDERAELKQDIAENGVEVAPEVCRIDGTRVLIDGWHRAELCIELGIVCPVHDRGDLSEAEARRRAYALNVPRRHLSPAEQERARRERPAKVLAKRIEGKSQRAIAAELGVSQPTVSRDLPPQYDDGSGDSAESPEPEGEHYTTGIDGKEYRQAPRVRVETPELDALRTAERAVKAALAAVETVLTGPGGDRLRAVATGYGVVIEGDVYLPLVALAAALGAALGMPG